MRLYIAGPMSNIPQFNFPLFDVWAANLRKEGFSVVSPHESDDQEVQIAARLSATGAMADLPPGKEGSDPVLTAIKNVEDVGGCDGLALLPGWYKSSGVIHEIATATRFQLPVAPVQMWYEIGNYMAREILS